MKRLFVAFKIKLNDELISLSRTIQSECKRDQITWVDPSLQHCTIRFIGKTPEPTIPLLQERLTVIAANYPAITLSMDKLGLFGSKYQPKVLWLGFSDFSELRPLFDVINQALIDLGLPEHEGNFVPHLTLGRIRMIDNKVLFLKKLSTDWQPKGALTVEVDSFQLIRSKLLNDGPRYSTMGEYFLQ